MPRLAPVIPIFGLMVAPVLSCWFVKRVIEPRPLPVGGMSTADRAARFVKSTFSVSDALVTVNGAVVLMLTGTVKSVVAGTLGLAVLPGVISPVWEFVATVWFTP